MRETRSLDREDPPGEGMATHSSILAWRIPWTEKPGGLPFIGFIGSIGSMDCSPPGFSVHGAAKSWTQLRLTLSD